MNQLLRPLLFLVALLAATPVARADSVLYPLPGHLDAAEGTLEFWLRLDEKPDPTGKEGVGYYILFQILKPGEPSPRVRLSYQPIWRNEHFHFFLSTAGWMNGSLTSNPYVVTTEDTQTLTKGDSGANRVPRIPRLKQGDWHHVAITWKGLPQSTVTMFLDGDVVIPPFLLTVPIWDGLDDFVLQLESNPYRDAHTLDELRISSVARSQAELRESIADGRARADSNTLLLDHMDEIREAKGKWQTAPEVFTLGYDVQGGVIKNTNMVALVEGKSGKGLRFLRHYK